MGELFTIKEYDTIISQKGYQGRYKYMEKQQFENLITFIYDFKATEDQSDILNFISLGYRRNLGNTITFRNYVGLIQLKNGFQIQILPKIDFNQQIRDQTKQVFIKMIQSMKDFPSKIFNNANLETAQMSIYEIFIEMYLKETRKLVKQGIQLAYVTNQGNLSYYQGKLLINKQLRKNNVHQERFYLEYDQFQADQAKNRIIKATLLKLLKITTSSKNAKQIRQLLVFFEGVSPSLNIDRDLAKITIDRTSKNYLSLIEWSKVFLKNKSFTPFSGNQNARALLFPMEKVFEAYVAKNMKRIFKRANYQVSSQDQSYYLFNQVNGQNEHRFALRPDLVVTRDDGSVVILDTKWKKLSNNKRSSYGISQQDMYQMYAYAKKYQTSEVWLLYPINNEVRDLDNIYFDSGDGVMISLFFVDVEDIESSLELLLEKLMSK